MGQDPLDGERCRSVAEGVPPDEWCADAVRDRNRARLTERDDGPDDLGERHLGVGQPSSGDADLPSLSYGHVAGDPTCPGNR